MPKFNDFDELVDEDELFNEALYDEVLSDFFPNAVSPEDLEYELECFLSYFD